MKVAPYFLSVLVLISGIHHVCASDEVTSPAIIITPEKITVDSVTWVRGQTPADIHWVWISVGKKGSDESTDYHLRVKDQKFAQKVYLLEGTGDYAIRVLTSSGALEGSAYSEDASFVISNSDLKDWSYLAPSQVVQSDEPEIAELALKITAGKTTDIEKSRAIYDWITHHIAYNIDDYSEVVARQKEGKALTFEEITSRYSALTTLQNKKGVCYGYSNLNAALHRAAGIRAKNVVGIGAWENIGQTMADAKKKKQTHGWNEIQIDQHWITEDSTWDAGNTDLRVGKFIRHPLNRYFNPDPGAFKRSHLKLLELKKDLLFPEELEEALK